jgi:hypothetical protein
MVEDSVIFDERFFCVAVTGTFRLPYQTLQLIMSQEIIYPKVTVLYNIVNSSTWIGTGWEFFDDITDAHARQAVLKGLGYCVTVRPFSVKPDADHLGAAHKAWPRVK